MMREGSASGGGLRSVPAPWSAGDAGAVWRLAAAARRDVEHARVAVREGHFEWAAFAAQQAAEKACKGLHWFLGGRPTSSDLNQLFNALPAASRPPAELLDRAKALDMHYITARYPHMFSMGTPHEHYTCRDASQAIASAEAIIEFCLNAIPQ